MNCFTNGIIAGSAAVSLVDDHFSLSFPPSRKINDVFAAVDDIFANTAGCVVVRIVLNHTTSFFLIIQSEINYINNLNNCSRSMFLYFSSFCHHCKQKRSFLSYIFECSSSKKTTHLRSVVYLHTSWFKVLE